MSGRPWRSPSGPGSCLRASSTSKSSSRPSISSMTRELNYLRTEIEREYDQDLGGSVLALLFDTFELQTDSEVRSEVIG